MPIVTVTDGLGSPIKLHEYNGKYFPPFTNVDLDVVLPTIKDLPGRDDDITIVSFPKAGCHWSWQIGHELLASQGARTETDKGDTMLEFCTEAAISKLPSVRLLNTHLTPEFYPTDLIRKKSKIIFIDRNPKDAFVSFFHHTRKIRLYDYDGSWNGFFELVMGGNNDYENWFDWTKQWEEFFKQHPELPLLRLNYEQMKMDLGTAVNDYAEFIGVSCDETFRGRVVDMCTFSTMKGTSDNHPIFRKGIVGDWKTHFTVAQNDRFDEEYRRQIRGFQFDFEKYMF